MQSDERLVQDARNGDEDAFVDLFRLYSGMVKSVAYHIVRDEHAAQDLAQEVFIKAYGKLGSLANGNRVDSWLYTVTKRTAIDWLRSQKRQPSVPHEGFEAYADPFRVEDDYIRKELSMLVRDALSNLDHPHRAAIILHDLRGYTAREIGTMTKESTNTIESRIRRARQKLQKELTPHTAKRIIVPAQAPRLVRQPSILLLDQEFEKRLVNDSILAVMLHLRRAAG